MKDEKKINPIVADIRDQVVAALNDKCEEILSRLDDFEQTLSDTLDRIVERDFTAESNHDLFED
jgi:hypothetical protein